MDNPKRIAIDLQALQTPGSRHRGIGQYAQSLLEGLFTLPESRTCEFVLLNLAPDVDHGLSLPGSVRTRVVRTGPNHLLLRRPIGRFYAPYLVRSFIQSERPSAFYIPSPFDACDIFHRRSFGDTPVVATVYDLIPLLYPTEYLKSPAAQRAYDRRLSFLRTCDHLLAISQTVKDDTVRLLAIDPNRVSVVYAAVPTAFHSALYRQDSSATTLTKYGIDKPYLLSMGAQDSRKNLVRLVQAYAGLPHGLRNGLHLVIVSQLGQRITTQVREAAKQCGVGSSIVLTGYVTSEDLVALYRCATAFVFLSLYEGFGLPLLEAMTVGTPVVTSNTSALGEVAGDAALTVAPTDVASIRHALSLLLEQTSLRVTLRARGLARASQFSWDSAARGLFRALEMISNTPPAAARSLR